jgi:hypothetical protein
MVLLLGTCLLRLQRSWALALKQGKNQVSNSKEDKNPVVWGTYQKDEKKKQSFSGLTRVNPSDP